MNAGCNLYRLKVKAENIWTAKYESNGGG